MNDELTELLKQYDAVYVRYQRHVLNSLYFITIGAGAMAIAENELIVPVRDKLHQIMCRIITLDPEAKISEEEERDGR